MKLLLLGLAAYVAFSLVLAPLLSWLWSGRRKGSRRG